MNYIKVVLFLVCALIFWILFGWLADYSFPFAQALELMLACFQGTVSSKINSLQQQLQKADVTFPGSNIQQVKKLNNLESQAWLYQGILDRLGNDPSVNHEKIARSLEALEYKRGEILRRLEPRRPQSYRVFAKIQDSAREILASQAEKDYEQLEKIVTNLVVFTKRTQPSQTILSRVIKQLATEISQNSDQISPYRLRLAYKIDELMKLLSERLIISSSDSGMNSGIDSDYQALIHELNSRINLISSQFNRLLKIRQENANEINNRGQKISGLTRKISDLHGTISNYETDLDASQSNAQELRKLIQSKQAQINGLENLIATLQRDIQGSTEVNQSQESQNNYLENQLSQLNQEKITLQQRIRDINNDIRRKDSEIIELKNEKSQLNSQKLHMHRENEILRQKSQQEENDLVSLNEQIEDLFQTERIATQPLTHSTGSSTASTAKPVATKSTISVEDYQRIANQDEYVYIDKYPRKDGTWVKSHYRRTPKKRRRSSR